MILRWVDGKPYADAAGVAILYEVSVATVRRYCTPAWHEPRAGAPRGGGAAMYDAFAAAEPLAKVVARPDRTLEARRRLASMAGGRGAHWPGQR